MEFDHVFKVPVIIVDVTRTFVAYCSSAIYSHIASAVLSAYASPLFINHDVIIVLKHIHSQTRARSYRLVLVFAVAGLTGDLFAGILVPKEPS